MAIDYLNAISTVGFPIVLTLYLMVKFEKTIARNTTAIKDLTIVIKSKRYK